MTVAELERVTAADNRLVAAGFLLSMLAERRSPTERVSLLEMVLELVRGARADLEAVA